MKMMPTNAMSSPHPDLAVPGFQKQPLLQTSPTGLQQAASEETQLRWSREDFPYFTQGSSFLATLGYVTESRWDSAERPANL